MQKVTTHFWFDKEAEEAVNFYTSIFKNSKVGNKSYYGDVGKEIHGQEAGKLMSVDFQLEGLDFIALNAGPVFILNPSISLFVRCKTIEELDGLYKKLSEGGSVLMPLDKYDFAEKYAWINDKYGVSWQIGQDDSDSQKIITSLLFAGDKAGKAEEAMKFYASLFNNSKVGDIFRYPAGQEPNIEGQVMFASFWLDGQEFAAMDSKLEHDFTFNEAVSLLVKCKDQAEIDELWEKLSAVPEAEACGWLKDKFGVSWQIVPASMDEVMKNSDQSKKDKVMDALLKMKKLDLATLEEAGK